LLEVQRDRALAAIGRHEHRRELTVAGGAAGDVAGERFDLDHVGALVGQQHGANRPRNDRRQVDDPDALQRT